MGAGRKQCGSWERGENSEQDNPRVLTIIFTNRLLYKEQQLHLKCWTCDKYLRVMYTATRRPESYSPTTSLPTDRLSVEVLSVLTIFQCQCLASHWVVGSRSLTLVRHSTESVAGLPLLPATLVISPGGGDVEAPPPPLIY